MHLDDKFIIFLFHLVCIQLVKKLMKNKYIKSKLELPFFIHFTLYYVNLKIYKNVCIINCITHTKTHDFNGYEEKMLFKEEAKYIK